MSALRSLFLLAALPLLAAADEPGLERSAPPTSQRRTVAPQSAATTPKAAPKAVRVFRFDALRVEGLAGPNALVLHDLQLGRRRSLVKRRRSFLHRMLEAVEVGARGRP